MSDYGQISIYNEIFNYIDNVNPKFTPLYCIENNKSYSFLYEKNEIPIMIGSKLDKYKTENPLKVEGYFIVNGICKAINNIKSREKINYSYNKCTLLNGEKIKILNMFSYTCNNKKWNIPSNYKDIIKYSNDKEKLENHFNFINKGNNIIKNEVDLITLCYMFDCWLGIRKPVYKWRLLTAGELIYNCIKTKKNVMNFLVRNEWSFSKYNKIYTISQDMTHYNLLNDIESLRKITLISNRENAKMNKRRVENEDKYKICPIQTSDGSLTGTINYLCSDTKINTKLKTDIKINESEKGKHIFVNNEYKGKGYIEIENCDIIEENEIIYIFNYYGRIIPGKSMISKTAENIKYIKHNPAIRSMFVCSMLKQAIMPKIYNSHIFDGKFLKSNNENIRLQVGIMPWYGYNIEDAIVISESAAKKYEYNKIRIYKSVDKVILNKYVKQNQYVIKGQLLYKVFDPEMIKTIISIYAEEDGKIESIKYESKYIKIVLLKEGNLKVGDKMTSLHGQKGIVSLIEKDLEMPYYYKNNEKIFLELLINPHAFPSRMTYGQILEMGEKEEILYINDKQVKNKILVGECRYISLRHQVDDKLQFRNEGKIDIITKQPIAGRKVGGGLRFGQMEKEILIAIGAKKTIEEIWKTDLIKINICPDSGIIEPNCKCKMEIKSHRFFTMCLGYIRSLGYDIRLFPDNTYSIVEDDINKYPVTDTLDFGDLNPLDLRIYNNKLALPMCLRSKNLEWLYNTNFDNKIKTEINKLLKSKKGVYHKYYEGHRVNNCIRSVISPNPKLDIDTVEVPYKANISTKYGLLNRQPSLNIGSIKLVKIKKSDKNTISFNPLLCKSFNADFDGDEMNIYGTNEIEVPFPVGEKTQDYILGDLKELTEIGLTANKEGIKLMIDNKSKGKDFNYKHLFSEIGIVILNNKKEGYIKNCYKSGLNDEEWYLSCKAARESIASIAVNTPITGYLESLCNQAYL